MFISEIMVKKPFVNLDLEKFSMSLKDKMEYNEIFIPPLYDSSDPKFIKIPHLFSVYYDSYQCILCGLYHPGIMLLGQLIEVTLKEIIFVHDNVPNQGPLEDLLKYSKDTTGRIRKNSTAPLLPKEINGFLHRVKDDIRNPYMHLNYNKLFKNDLIKVIKFNVGESFQEIQKKSERIKTKSQQGEIPYVEENPAIDNLIADSVKRDNEPNWAINWAWEIYPFFELLVDEYLTYEDYQKHAKFYDSNVNKMVV